MPTVVICRGLQGSGKTTWAKNWVSENFEHRVRINKDDLRSMLSTQWYPELEEIVYTIMKYAIKTAVLSGKDIVIDNTNLSEKNVDVIIDTVKYWKGSQKYELLIKGFPTPIEECILRDSMRHKPVGEKVIRETYKYYKETIDSLCNKEYIVDL